MESKSPILGFVLIGILLVIWMWYMTPAPTPPKPAAADTVHAAIAKVDTAKPVPVAQPAVPDTGTSRWGKYFTADEEGTDGFITIKTDLYVATLSTRGGLIKEWELTRFKTWDQQPVELVDYSHRGDLSLLFTSTDGRLIDTHDLYFRSSFPAGSVLTLTGNDSTTVDFTLPAGDHSALVKRLVFTNGSYSIHTAFLWRNMEAVVSNYEYQIVWQSGLRYAEENSVDESSFAMAYAKMGGEVKDLDATKPNEVARFDGNGNTSWVAARTKYFALAMIPQAGESQGAYLEGRRHPEPNHGEREAYTIALKMPLKGGASDTARVTLFLGPLDYDIVRSYGVGLEDIMNLGAAWIIRPIAEYVMLPVFKFLRMIIPNYGVVIIVFAVIIMVVTLPLTRSSTRSMKKMQALQPLMEGIKEKYKDDPQKMNQATWNLYKEYGVNPGGGCLPILLQMPVLFALYAVLRSNIALRQAHFIWWIHDLAIPDTVLNLPFTIPFFGITALSGLALVMGITTFVQQKLTVTDPRQKGMVYIMPVFLTLVFNSLPAGLNLYYFTFNVLSIGQRLMMNRSMKDEPLRKVDPKKKQGGIMGRLTKDLPKLK
jgi:YidC/Oxa1 family membrane protein insertase